MGTPRIPDEEYAGCFARAARFLETTATENTRQMKEKTMTDYTPEQQAQHRKMWTDALRSGEYTQGYGALRTPSLLGYEIDPNWAPEEKATAYVDRFCCLGVACEVAKKEGVIESYVSNDTVLPDEVRHWLGLSSEQGMLREAAYRDDPSTSMALWQLNDFVGESFDQIADRIDTGQVKLEGEAR